ncbi:hypertrehalosaemic prohormone [Homalodisca vitripennis]|uniref:hypertrehalosaemic prohormone n=1 Tax=Homalodisca vitripennis TaxID=197043 RepID=UPI001EEB2366|nr:hypertrehalosaemic prohormone [Homalodisca vitripennis]
MYRTLLTVMLALALVTVCCAQVNFSPSWGKRGVSQQDGCKASMDSLMYLYKLVQSEAQKIVDCEKFAN